MERFARILCFIFLTLGYAAPGAAQGQFVPSADVGRNEVPEPYTWDLGALFQSVGEWEALFQEVETGLPKLDGCKGQMGLDTQFTADCLDLYYDLKRKSWHLNAYAFQLWSIEMTESSSQILKDRSIALIARLGEAGAFINPELQKIELEKWQSMLKEEERLKQYNFPYMDLKRLEKHILSAKEEALIALTMPVSEGPYDIMNALYGEMDFPKIEDETGKSVTLSNAVFSRYRGSKDPEVRKKAVEAFFNTLYRYRSTLASSLATSVKAAVFVAKARGYGSTLEMSLDADAVPVEVYETLLATTAENLPRTLHRYVELRKKILKLDKIHYYDLYNPLLPEADQTYTYDQSVALVSDSLKPMGDEYLAIVTAGMKPGSGWTDVYPNKGKKGGAYCNAAYGIHPYVFLNHTDKLDDVFTLAHEFGHAMHFHLASQAQPFPVADSTIFLAEIASTFHEELLLHNLLQKAKTKQEKLILLNKRVENIRLTITRQTMFAEFEKLIHAEVESTGSLTADRLSAIYGELILKYFGPGFTVGEFDHMEWAYIPHFYYNFYVYKYSTGLMSAIVFSKRVIEKKKGAVEQFRALLEAGGSDYPLVVLEKSGIDFRKKDIVQSTYDLFAATLDEMEKLLK